jgi:hypothetical protein
MDQGVAEWLRVVRTIDDDHGDQLQLGDLLHNVGHVNFHIKQSITQRRGDRGGLAFDLLGTLIVGNR